MQPGAAILLVAGAAVLWPAKNLSAQTEIRIGPMVGVNNATFRGDDAGDVETRTGFLAGGFLSFGLNRQLALQPELVYSQKGAKATFEDVTGTIALDYVEIPVLAQVRFPAETWTPWFIVGPAFAFRADCSVSLESSEGDISADCSDADVGVKETDFSLIGGVGLEFNSVMISLRYNHGLSSLPDQGPDAVYNRTFSLTVGYAFRLGR